MLKGRHGCVYTGNVKDEVSIYPKLTTRLQSGSEVVEQLSSSVGPTKVFMSALNVRRSFG